MNAQAETPALRFGTAGVAEQVPAAAAVRAAAIETFHDAAADERLARRLSVVGATVAFELRDRPDLAFGVRLQDGAIAILDHDEERADVRITLDARDLHEIFDGGLHLPMKIARGQVGYRGPVRRFLRITAILANLREVYREHLAVAAADGSLR